MGFYEYYMAQYPEFAEYVQDDWVTVAHGYLKALQSMGTTTTQESQTFITSTFINMVPLSSEENTKVEEALQRMIDGEYEQTNRRTQQAQDAQIKNDVGSLATELQAYYTTPGEGLYPSSLQELVNTGGLRQIPEHPAGGNYEYIVCSGNGESLIYAKLVNTENYWVWTSKTNIAQEVATQPNVNTCINGSSSEDKVVLGEKDSQSTFEVFWNNIKNSISSP